MGVKIIHYKSDFLNIRIHLINEIFDLFGPVCCCTVFADTYMKSAAKRFYKSKYTAGSMPRIFGITFLLSPGRIAQDSLTSPISW